MRVFIMTIGDVPHITMIGPDMADIAALHREWLTTAPIDVTLADMLGIPMFTQWLRDAKGWQNAHPEPVVYCLGEKDISGLDGITDPWGDVPDPHYPAPCDNPASMADSIPDKHIYHATRRADGTKEWECIGCLTVVSVKPYYPVITGHY